MNSLFDISTRSGIRMDKYLQAWSLRLFHGKDFATLPDAARVAEQQRLAASVKKLWKSFNANRKNLEKHYLEDPEVLRAYAGSFLIPNVQRIFAIATSPEVSAALAYFATLDRPLRIMDFGAGPLAASTGIVAALCHENRLQFEISAIERSVPAFQLGKELLTAAFANPERLKVSSATSVQKVTGMADVILAANVFNELPVAHREKTLRGLLEKLDDNGVAIILEPGQDVHARDLSSLRNSLVKNPPFRFDILAPCLHKKKCPLSAESERSDWCWFQNTWKPPMLLAELDRYSGLRHSELNYSYLVIQKTAPSATFKKPETPSYFARLVSDAITVGGAKNGSSFLRWARSNTIIDGDYFLEDAIPDTEFQKTLLCTRDGELEAALGSRAPGRRGDLILEKDVPCRCQERTGLTNPKTGFSTGERNRRDIELHSPRSRTKPSTKKPVQLAGKAKSPKPHR